MYKARAYQKLGLLSTDYLLLTLYLLTTYYSITYYLLPTTTDHLLPTAYQARAYQKLGRWGNAQRAAARVVEATATYSSWDEPSPQPQPYP